MISFGDFRKRKMVKGENPLAKGLGICLFDYVYIFLDDFQNVKYCLIFRLVNEWNQELSIWKKIRNSSIEI